RVSLTEPEWRATGSYGERRNSVVSSARTRAFAELDFMRFRILAIVASLAIGATALSGCEKKEEQKPVASATYDLTPASNQKYLADNALKPGVTRRPSGL